MRQISEWMGRTVIAQGDLTMPGNMAPDSAALMTRRIVDGNAQYGVFHVTETPDGGTVASRVYEYAGMTVDRAARVFGEWVAGRVSAWDMHEGV